MPLMSFAHAFQCTGVPPSQTRVVSPVFCQKFDPSFSRAFARKQEHKNLLTTLDFNWSYTWSFPLKIRNITFGVMSAMAGICSSVMT